MKYERCPNCNGRLKIPNKKRGQPVECPVCHLEFVPPVRSETEAASPVSQQNQLKSKPKKPTLRGLPIPTAIAKDAATTVTEPTIVKAAIPVVDPLMPPARQRVSPLAPTPSTESPPSDLRQGSSGKKNESSVVEKMPTTEVEYVAAVAKGETLTSGSESGTSPKPDSTNSKAKVATIIKSDAVQPLLTKEGNLPTLQLKDAAAPKPKDGDLKSKPLLLVLVICGSLLSSGLMLLMVGMNPTSGEKEVREARENIREFYEVRVDEELAPFQRELREAQLAHSRGDNRTEIRCYQQVMARFRSEDRSEFSGLTGSPTWDIELEELVSVLLNDAKRKSKR